VALHSFCATPTDEFAWPVSSTAQSEKFFSSISFFSDQVANQFVRMTTAGRTMDQRVESVARYRRRTVCNREKGCGFSGDFVWRKE
jgi:hypothetical protein